MGVFRVYQAMTPYNASQLSELDYAQSFSTMYLTHSEFAVGKMVRNDADDWEFSYVSFGPTISAPGSVTATATVANTDAANSGDAYFPQEYSYIVSAVDENGIESRGSTADDATNDLSLKRNYTTITWGAVSGAVRYRVYKAHESGSFGLIVETEETSAVDDNIAPELSDAPIEGRDPFDSTGNYPASCEFFEQRLFFGQTDTVPSGVWASRSAEFENFDVSRPLRESDALSFSIATGDLNEVEGFVPMTDLLVMTSDNVVVVRGANEDYVAAAPPPVARPQISEGVDRLKPIRIRNQALYQPADDDGVRTVGYSFEVDGQRSNDVTIFAPHLFEGKRIVAWSYCRSPKSVIWTVLDDGTALAFTWEPDQDIWGWTRFTTAGNILDVCSVPEAGEDRAYFVIERTINGEEVVFFERMASSKWTNTDAAPWWEACFLDCAKTYTAEDPFHQITALDHLEGEAVKVVADGFVLDAVVQNGAIDIGEANAATTIHVGLAYDVSVETLPLPDEYHKKATGPVVVDMVDSAALLAGRNDDDLYEVVLRENEALASPSDLFTGSEEIRTGQQIDRGATIILKQTAPVPLTITGLYWPVK